ncbi:hypothetical protein LCGC14_2067590, partial [marine sediment metagenome]
PHTWEHSLEVQLPMLQRVLKGFELVPVVFGKADPAAAAEVLIDSVLDDRTIIVASSDLSHYYPDAVARRLDELCVRDIVNLDIEAMARHEACGMKPILTLMHIARRKRWQAKLLATANSADASGDKTRVVGYAAVAFVDSQGPNTMTETTNPPPGPAPAYTSAQRQRLLKLARTTLVRVVKTGELPEVDAGDFADELGTAKGCFVTLTVGGQLRGCIGHILPREPLYRAVMECTQSAALRDTRFKPVKPEELDRIEIEISVLTVPQPLAYASPIDLLTKLRPHVDGVLLRVGQAQSTYLPQVWEQMPNKGIFLSTLARKAGLAATGWQDPKAKIWTYQAEAFTESEQFPSRPAPGAH